MDLLEAKRKVEHQKYERTYTSVRYRMKKERMKDAVHDLESLPVRGSYLDVSCGRGDMLNQAELLGYDPVFGTEIVKRLLDGERIRYGEVHALPFPDKSVNVASMFDVIEHLIPGDDELACKELMRVARHHILITANNKESVSRPWRDVLHINRRPYEQWNKLFNEWFVGARVIWIKGKRNYISEAWRIDL